MNSRTTNSSRETSRSKHSRTAASKLSSKTSKKSSSKKRSGSHSDDWMQEVQSGARSFENKITNVITTKPFISLAIAAGVGLISYFVVKSISESSDGESVFDESIENAPSRLAESLSTTLEIFQSEFNSLSQSSFSDVKDNIIELVTDSVSENPFGALATAASIGFGVGGLHIEDLKQGAIRLAKMAAVQSLEGFTGSVGGSAPRIADSH